MTVSNDPDNCAVADPPVMTPRLKELSALIEKGKKHRKTKADIERDGMFAERYPVEEMESDGERFDRLFHDRRIWR